MNAELLRSRVNERYFPDEKERSLAELMFDHWEGIRGILEIDPHLEHSHLVMNWREITADNGGKVMVVTGLLPAIDKDDRKIPDMRATPSVICIPKSLCNDDEWQLFDQDTKVMPAMAERREAMLRRKIHDAETMKYYGLHGWGANPYPFVMPMSDVAAANDGISILTGVMGSMGSTFQDLHPRMFRDTASYNWDSIRSQAIGAMYYLEGREAFQFDRDNVFRRIVLGHSMQGKSVLRLLLDNRSALPNTYFVSMVPLLAGGDKQALAAARAQKYLSDMLQHVTLGHDLAGLGMKAELSTIGRLKAEARAGLLCGAIPLYLVNCIVNHYLHPEAPYGEALTILAHVLEYTENPWAIMLESTMLETSEPAMSQATTAKLPELYGLFMLVYAGRDRVLTPTPLIRLASESEEAKRKHYRVELESELNLQILTYSNHYFYQGAWGYLWKQLPDIKRTIAQPVAV